MSAPPLRLGDRYRIGDVIGRGGMADVHRAHDTVLDRSVAVKILRDVNAVDARRFADESRLLASLDHPHIVRLLDTGAEDERPWIALELVEGSTLRELMSAGPLDPETAARIGRDVSSALAHAHDAGVIHRDVKPANILVRADGTAQLSDFGTAKLDDGRAGVTLTGHTIGTAAYLSPEQVGGGPVSSAGDVYALGLVLLEALTAVRAYPGPPLEAAVARLTVAPLTPTSLPTGWLGLLTGMTYREAARRLTARDVARRLESSRPLPADGPEPAETSTVMIAARRRRPTSLVAIRRPTRPHGFHCCRPGARRADPGDREHHRCEHHRPEHRTGPARAGRCTDFPQQKYQHSEGTVAGQGQDCKTQAQVQAQEVQGQVHVQGSTSGEDQGEKIVLVPVAR